MKEEEYTGDYTKAFVSETPMENNSSVAKSIKKNLKIELNEAVYIYSFKENKMIFVQGFKELFGIEDEKLNMTDMIELHTNEVSIFLNEINDKTLHQIHHKTNYQDVKTLMIINVFNKITKQSIPVLRSIYIYESNENGNLISIIARYKKDDNLKTSNIIPYGVVSKKIKDDFLIDINFNLNYKNAVSIYEIKIIELLEKEYNHLEIQEKLEYSEKELKKIISNLFLRFKTYSKSELINFAKKNYFLPNPFLQKL